MAALALVDALPDFGTAERPRARAAGHAPAPQPKEPPQQPEWSQRLEEDRVASAVTEAEAALALRLNAQHAEAFASLEARHAEEIKQLHATLGDQAGRLIEARFAELESGLVGLISSAVARILGVAVSDDIKQNAIDELARSILAAIGDREAVRINVHGPVSLCEALRQGLGAHAEQIQFSEGPGFDLTVSVGNTLFETRMAEWSSALSEALA